MQNLLTVSQVAAILHIHPLSVRRYITQGKLQAIKIAGNIRIPQENLQALERQAAPRQERPSQSPSRLLLHVFRDSDPLFRLEGRGAKPSEK